MTVISLKNAGGEPPPSDLPFTGERFVVGSGVEITYDHWLRYVFAGGLADGKRVLDLASGEGYGAAYLAARARSVDGVELDALAVEHARSKYRAANLTYHLSDVARFLENAPAGAFDLVTCFEFIEHVGEAEQERVLAGIKRVLAPGGLVLVSTPDKRLYTDAVNGTNAYHVRELYRDEFAALVGRHLAHVRMLEQATHTGAVLFEPGATSARLVGMGWTDLVKLQGRAEPALRGTGKYLVAVASDAPIPDAACGATALVDLSRKLVGEEIYNQHLEVERLRARVAELEAEQAKLAEVRADFSLHQALFERTLSLLARTQDDLTQGQRAQSELALLRRDLEAELQRRQTLENMLSVKVALKAKRALDHAPGVKRLVKAVLLRGRR